MTGQHRKGVTVTFDANLPAVRKYIDDAIAVAVNQAAHAIRAVRDCAAAVRALLPDIPSSAEGVEQVDGTRVTRDDREYPGGTDSGN